MSTFNQYRLFTIAPFIFSGEQIQERECAKTTQLPSLHHASPPNSREEGRVSSTCRESTGSHQVPHRERQSTQEAAGEIQVREFPVRMIPRGRERRPPVA